VLLKRVRTSQIGGLNPAIVYAIGNLLIVAENRSGAFATMDISDPANPTLIQNFDGKSGYSHIFAAGKIFIVGGQWRPKQNERPRCNPRRGHFLCGRSWVWS
jgi:hypothetical protein